MKYIMFDWVVLICNQKCKYTIERLIKARIIMYELKYEDKDLYW